MQGTRLARYSGSERLALITTSAWYYLRKGKQDIALKKINAARSIARTTDISYAMRASIDWATAQIEFRNIMHSDSPSDKIKKMEEILNILEALYTYTSKAGLLKYKYRATLLWSNITIECHKQDIKIPHRENEIKNSILALKRIIKNKENIGELFLIRKASQLLESADEALLNRIK